MEVFIEVGVWYPGRIGDGDRGGRRTGCGDSEVCYRGGRWVYNDWVHGWTGCGCGLIDLVWEFSVEFWCGKKFWCGKTIFGGCTCYPNFGGETILI